MIVSTQEAIALAQDSAARLTAAVRSLDERELNAPARLDGWTRAFGIAHITQALGAYIRLLRSAARDDGPTTAAYHRAVEESAARPGRVLLAELAEGAEQFLALARTLDERAWEREVTSSGGWRHSARYTLLRCLRELETHHTDLDLGYESAKWPLPYVHWALDDTFTTLRTRDFPLAAAVATDLGVRWELAGSGPVAEAPGPQLLAWLAGRGLSGALTDQSLPLPPPWPQPPVV
ncbi:maleylpyruvate isomerase family mycothiol-dependent enzyme [Streptomyces sp. NPDC050418]|uniref:maleylpyruvate isomerase family mycothiol-dependent enzyme n=1 Tax=Streptomyces sp. NPDC050418 TaxID=3365612 RepID=UPI0037AE1A7D